MCFNLAQAHKQRKRSHYVITFEEHPKVLANLKEQIAISKKSVDLSNNFDWLRKLMKFYHRHHYLETNENRDLDTKDESCATDSVSSCQFKFRPLLLRLTSCQKWKFTQLSTTKTRRKLYILRHIYLYDT